VSRKDPSAERRIRPRSDRQDTRRKSAPERRRALVVGGSIAGLFAALMLLRRGWEVQVFERSSGQLAARGAGIVTHPELMQALEASGAQPEGPIGLEICERVIVDRQGAPIRRLQLPQLVTSWSYLYELLRGALPAQYYRTGHALVDFEQTATGVSASFANGTHASGDILIAADGINSTARALLMPEMSPHYVGYVAWRGLVPESELSAASRRLLADRFGFYLPPGEQILGYPVPGLQNSLLAGSRHYNFVWYRPIDERYELPALLTDREEVRHQTSLPPDALRAEVVAELRREAEQLLPPAFAEVVHLAPQPFIQAIYELESPRLVFGRVALVGDAAFLARPHVGMGVTKAAGDILALAEALGADPDRIDQALEGFQARRLEFGKKVAERSRYLGQLIRAGTSSPELLDSTSAQVISLTAVAPSA
jgi:2-polyprenyl-6-methoxyphenol hydroxylase-like FAD-dependent oxidoreductase